MDFLVGLIVSITLEACGANCVVYDVTKAAPPKEAAAAPAPITVSIPAPAPEPTKETTDESK